MDYPIGFVRWTEARNFEAVLQLMAEGKLDVEPLISHRFDFSKALEAYEVVSSGKALGIVLNYSSSTKDSERSQVGSGQLAVGSGPASPELVDGGKLARTVSIRNTVSAGWVPVDCGDWGGELHDTDVVASLGRCWAFARRWSSRVVG